MGRYNRELSARLSFGSLYSRGVTFKGALLYSASMVPRLLVQSYNKIIGFKCGELVINNEASKLKTRQHFAMHARQHFAHACMHGKVGFWLYRLCSIRSA